MAGEFIEFFEELLFGSGAWLGLMLILAIGFIVASTVKYSGLVFILIYIFMFFEYFDEMGGLIAVSSTFMWACIIDLVAVALMGVMFYKSVVTEKRR